MVIGVSRQAEVDWRRNKIPRMILVYRFVNTILVLVTLQSVVSDVVSKRLEPKTEECKLEMEFKSIPSKKQIDRNGHQDVKKIVPSHSVKEDESEQRAVPSMLLSNSMELPLPHALVSAIDLSRHVRIY